MEDVMDFSKEQQAQTLLLRWCYKNGKFRFLFRKRNKHKKIL